MKRFWIVFIFLVLLALLAAGLKLDPSQVPSPLVGKPMPSFSVQDLHTPQQVLKHDDWLGQPALINVWASWCVACLSEHPILIGLAREYRFPIYGINYKDQRGDALAWLQQHGNPYAMSVHDENGRVGIDWGVYGVPETFVIDSTGIIHYKHIGPIDDSAVRDTIIPLIQSLATQ